MTTRLAGTIRQLRWLGAATGLAAVVFAFFPWVTFHIPATPNNPQYDNWVFAFASGYTAWTPVAALVLAGLLALLQRKWFSLLWLLLCVAAFGVIIYRWITVDQVSADALNVSNDKFSELESITNAYSQPGIGLYVTLVLAVVSAVAAWLTFWQARRSRRLDSAE